jgi:hypothetical protein
VIHGYDYLVINCKVKPGVRRIVASNSDNFLAEYCRFLIEKSWRVLSNLMLSNWNCNKLGWITNGSIGPFLDSVVDAISELINFLIEVLIHVYEFARLGKRIS